MYRVDLNEKRLIKLSNTTFSQQNIRERFDIQEWVEKTPDILGEDLLIIAKEYVLPSGKRLDLLAVDKSGNLVVIELKRDDSGEDTEWQAIKYTSYISGFSTEEIFSVYAEYLGTNDDDAHDKIESFIDEELDTLNKNQRIILVSKEYNPEVLSAVLWLRDYEIDISCIRLTPFIDEHKYLFIKPEILIPLPEAKDYIKKKEFRQREQQRHSKRGISFERGSLSAEELKQKLLETFERPSDLTPRLIEFIKILLSEDKIFQRDEIKTLLFERNIGDSLSQAGRYLSNISQYLTNPKNPHLRQVIEFPKGSFAGEKKENYRINSEYRELLSNLLICKK